MKAKFIVTGMLLLAMAVFMGGCQACKQQYNAVNYSCGAAYKTSCELHEANVIGDAALEEAYEVATAIEMVRPELRAMATANACFTDNWREALIVLQTLLAELQDQNRNNLERLQVAYADGRLRGMSDNMIIRIIDLILELLIRWPVANDEIDAATETWVTEQFERLKQKVINYRSDKTVRRDLATPDIKSE